MSYYDNINTRSSPRELHPQPNRQQTLILDSHREDGPDHILALPLDSNGNAKLNSPAATYSDADTYTGVLV